MSEVILIIISLIVCANQLSAQIITWYENAAPGIIKRIETDNGGFYEPNYEFNFDETIDKDFKNKFDLSSDGILSVFVPLDREQQKDYFLPIRISNKDNSKDNIVKQIHLIVADENDNEMKEGKSSIKILKMEGTKLPNMEIGRVFVDDLDDNDLDDKVFRWSDHNPVSIFNLDEKTGMINISATVNDSQKVEGEYNLDFSVIERTFQFDHAVNALVNVLVKNVPEEAIRKSGSIRFHGIKVEQFIRMTLNNNLNSIEVLRNLFVDLFETEDENVEIITISQKSIKPLLMDIRFYVQSNESGDYYEPELMKIKLFEYRKIIENTMNLKIQMINIDECASMNCITSCYNEIMILPNYIPVITNQSSFYGINSYVRAQCGCETLTELISSNVSVSNVIEFKGNGYAIYNGISHCDTMNITLNINSYTSSGIILYIGPVDSDEIKVGDSVELKLESELLILTLNYGSEFIQLERFKLPKQKNHSIEIIYQNNKIELVVKDCHLCQRKFETFETTKLPKLSNPIQLGGIVEFLRESFSLYQGFVGCISDFTINGRIMNAMTPLLHSNVSYECHLIKIPDMPVGFFDSYYHWLLVALVTVLTLVSIVIVLCTFCKKRKAVLKHEDENHYFFDNSKRESGILLGNNRESFKNDQNFY